MPTSKPTHDGTKTAARKRPGTPTPDSLVLYIVQKAYEIWDDLRWLNHDHTNWRWIVTPEIRTALRAHRWIPPDPDDERYPPGYPGPVREDPQQPNRILLFGIAVATTLDTMNHNTIELRIRR